MYQAYEALNKALQEFNRLQIPEQLDFQKLYLYSIITHSTAIEGSTVSEIENTLMFDDGIVPGGHNIIEQMMNFDLKKAYDYVSSILKEKPVVTVDFLKKLSSIVMKNTGSEYTTALGTFDSSAGDIRLVNVSAGRGGKSYLNFQKVPQKLEDFCKWLNTERKKTFSDAAAVYIFSFEAHYRLVSIHPWADGNGRIARLLMNMVQMEQGVLPSILKKENKANYMKSLAESQENEDSSVFINFMLNSMLDYIEKSIDEFKNENSIDKINNEFNINLDGLYRAFERFEANGSYASCGDWEIKQDLLDPSGRWTAYYQGISVVKCSSHDNYEDIIRVSIISDIVFSRICDAAHAVFPKCRMSLAEKRKIQNTIIR